MDYGLREEYISRVNRVIDYIEKHIDSEMKLEQLADIANFSRFHFHRIFSAFTGETLNKFIQRIRIEKASDMLLNNKKYSISEIAFDCGFSGSATFARVFQGYFGMSASQWRDGGFKNHEKKHTAKMISGNPEKRTKFDFKTDVKNIPETYLAYVRHIGPYQGDGDLFAGLFGKLAQWAGPRGLIKFPETQFMSVYHDNPELTDDDKLRLSVCMTIDKGTEVDGEIGYMILEGGKYAVARFEILPNQYGDAWAALFGEWLPSSGYQPDDRPCFEIYHNDPNNHPEGKHIVDICTAVKLM